MNIITGREMGMSLERAVQRYVEFGLLEGGSCKAIGAAVAGLKSARKSESWEYSISKGNPIKFNLDSAVGSKQDLSKLLMLAR